MNKQIHRNVKFNQAHHEYSPSEFHPSKTKIQNDS